VGIDDGAECEATVLPRGDTRVKFT